MARVVSVKRVGVEPVYNMTVEEHHNFMIQGNVIVKNCDALRYFCVWWTSPAKKPVNIRKRKWSADMYEDYRNANTEERKMLIERWGHPA